MGEIVIESYGMDLICIDGKWYKLQKEEVLKRDEEGHKIRQVYRELDIEEYKRRLKGLAKELCSAGNVKPEDIVYDALKDLPVEKIAEVEKALTDEVKKEKPKVRTRSGCLAIEIGKGRYKHGEVVQLR